MRLGKRFPTLQRTSLMRDNKHFNGSSTRKSIAMPLNTHPPTNSSFEVFYSKELRLFVSRVMALLRVVFLSVAIFCLSSHVKAQKCRFTEFTPSGEDNEYMNKISGNFEDTKLNLKMAVRKAFPESALMAMKIEIGGQLMYDGELELCNAFEDPIAKAIIECGKPDGEFPQECIVPPGDYTIDSYEVPESQLSSCPEGPLKAWIKIFDGDVTFCEFTLGGEVVY